MKLTLTYKDFRKSNMFQNHPLRIKIYEEMNKLPTLLGSYLFLESKIYCIPEIAFEELIKKAKNKKKIGIVHIQLEEWDVNSIFLLIDRTDWYVWGAFKTKEKAFNYMSDEGIGNAHILKKTLQ